MTIYAWIGLDELGSGVVGLKQGIVPAGYIPLVALERGKIDTPAIRAQLHAQARRYGVPIRLVAFDERVGGEALAELSP